MSVNLIIRCATCGTEIDAYSALGQIYVNPCACTKKEATRLELDAIEHGLELAQRKWREANA